VGPHLPIGRRNELSGPRQDFVVDVGGDVGVFFGGGGGGDGGGGGASVLVRHFQIVLCGQTFHFQIKGQFTFVLLAPSFFGPFVHGVRCALTTGLRYDDAIDRMMWLKTNHQNREKNLILCLFSENIFSSKNAHATFMPHLFVVQLDSIYSSTWNFLLSPFCSDRIMGFGFSVF